jgi:hypothetical protein
VFESTAKLRANADADILNMNKTAGRYMGAIIDPERRAVACRACALGYQQEGARAPGDAGKQIPERARRRPSPLT